MDLKILRITENSINKLTDSVTDEVIVDIYIDYTKFVSLSCSPKNFKELAIGFLYSSSVIDSISEVKDILVSRKKHTVYVKLKNSKKIPGKIVYTSSCGKGIIPHKEFIQSDKIETDIKISLEDIFSINQKFQNMSLEFKKTGGVHSACFSDGKKIIFFDEDIGRHNAVDKIIGAALIKNTDLTKMILFTSGRVSLDIIHKVLRCKIPIIVSHGAPTSQAVKLCKKKNITLIGFARPKRLNLYCGYQRILNFE